jgi:hypothetical protein
VTIGTAEENQRFLVACEELLSARDAASHFGEHVSADRFSTGD